MNLDFFFTKEFTSSNLQADHVDQTWTENRRLRGIKDLTRSWDVFFGGPEVFF